MNGRRALSVIVLTILMIIAVSVGFITFAFAWPIILIGSIILILADVISGDAKYGAFVSPIIIVFILFFLFLFFI